MQDEAKKVALAGGITLITGGGGCGKTHVTAQVIEEWFGDVIVIAPTNLAKITLASRINREDVTYKTVAGFLSKNVDYTANINKFNETVFIKMGDSIEGCKHSLLVIEEISMVSESDLAEILEAWKGSVLMLGDFKQIPPVKGRSCRQYLLGMRSRKELNHVGLVKNYRSTIGISEFIKDISQPAPEGVYKTHDRAEFEKLFAEDKGSVAIAYTNDRVNYLMLRANQSNDLNLKIGQDIRLHSPITINKKINGKWETITLANNGEILQVKGYRDGLIYKHPWSDIQIPYALVDVGFDEQIRVISTIKDGINNKNGSFAKLFTEVLHKVNNFNGELGLYEEDLHFMERYGESKNKHNYIRGRVFYGERAKFINATPTFAITAHKSQGQSIDHVYADLRNINMSSDYINLTYVACSRAKTKLTILL